MATSGRTRACASQGSKTILPYLKKMQELDGCNTHNGCRATSAANASNVACQGTNPHHGTAHTLGRAASTTSVRPAVPASTHTASIHPHSSLLNSRKTGNGANETAHAAPPTSSSSFIPKSSTNNTIQSYNQLCQQSQRNFEEILSSNQTFQKRATG